MNEKEIAENNQVLEKLISELEILGLSKSLRNIFDIIKSCEGNLNGTEFTFAPEVENLDKLNLSHCTDIDVYNSRLNETKLCLKADVGKMVTDIDSIADLIDSIRQKAKDKKNKLINEFEELNSYMKKIEKEVRESGEYIDKYTTYSINLAYMKAIKNTSDLSSKIAVCYESNDIEKAIDNYLFLSDVLHILIKSKCSHLFQYVHDTVAYWNGILKKNLSDEFMIIMKSVQWPNVGSNTLTAVPSPDAMTNFQTYVEYLLLVDLPLEADKKLSVSSTVVITFPVISSPISLLIHPLRRRFLYHFTGSRKTNRIDKPEWYFSQILNWIHDHETFITTWVQPIFNDLGINRSATTEFISGLVGICLEKLQSDLEQASYDDVIFSHMVDEALGFHKELTDSYPYPQSLPSTPAILSQAHLFIKWINMERKFARDKMDSILHSESAWCDMSPDEKITEVGHSFLAMLSAITERFSALSQPGHRLQFVELEIELVDDLRVSLLQVLHSERSDPLNSKLPSILNTVQYLYNNLQQWDISPSMLLLNHYKIQLSGSTSTGLTSHAPLMPDSEGGIFEESLSLLRRLENDLTKTLSDAVLMEVKAKSRPYRNDNWLVMAESDLENMTLTPSACPMYQVLAEKLHHLSERLAPKVFDYLWRSVASRLNMYLYEEVLLENGFSRWGGKVLERDVMKCLLPLFQQYTETTAVHQFDMLKEACCILSLANLPLAVKKAAIVGSNFDLFNSLPISIKHLPLDQVALVIKRRADSVSSHLM